MSEQESISAFFEQDHDRLDELLKSFRSLKRSDFPRAAAAFGEFKVGLQRHILWEEELLFPLWEEKTGMSRGGPTFVMRAEHRLIEEQLEAIHRKVLEKNLDSSQEEDALLALLGSHNMKEEQVLYPSIDQSVTPQESTDIFEKLKLVGA